LKLLFLANRIPFPPYRGDKLKIFNLARRLSGRHELHLLTFTQTEEDKGYRKELEAVFREVHLVHLPKWKSAVNCLRALYTDLPLQVLYFQSEEMKHTLDQLLGQHKFDAIHVQHLRMAPYLSSRKDLPRILDLPDAFSLYWERRKKVNTGFIKTFVEDIEQKRLLKFERVLKEFQLSLVCSQEDLDYLQDRHHVDNLRLLPNGVDLDTFAPGNHDYSHNHTLLFTGNMDYAPNVDAALYFMEEIFPVVQKQFPKVRFVIAGQRPVQKIMDLAGEHVVVTGFVKDLAEVYRQASVVVAPLRFGAGTQNKVLEAMAVGVPVVCSNIGFKGLGIRSGEGAIMQTDPAAFASSVCDLLSSEQLRQEVGSSGVNVTRARFDWEAVTLQLEKYFNEVKGS
jgi:sugar transferase (PEP-CTERM/EpsH1 system associated)